MAYTGYDDEKGKGSRQQNPLRDDGNLSTPTTKPFWVGLMTTSIDIVILGPSLLLRRCIVVLDILNDEKRVKQEGRHVLNLKKV